MNQEPQKPHTLAVLVDNAAGVLSQVSRLFSRKGYNIDSLAVGPTDDPSVSRITIEITTDDGRARLLCNQLRKQIPVHSVTDLTERPSLRRSLMLVKVRVPSSAAQTKILEVASVFRASVVDMNPQCLTLAVIGDDEKAEGLQRMLEEFGILELARTGTVALERGLGTISDQTKMKGEFDYGKNLL